MTDETDPRTPAAVDSSNLEAVGADGDDLLVRFKRGGVYRYRGAGHLLPSLLAAESAGRFLARFVRNRFSFDRLCAVPGCPRPAEPRPATRCSEHLRDSEKEG
jgi:hypothetical protein